MRKKRIFISCGQRLREEKIFGLEIQQLINESMVGFFAEHAHDASDLNTSLFRELQNCDGFVAVMQKRGEVKYSDSPAQYRASVWIQQEIAMPLPIISTGATNSYANLFGERYRTRGFNQVLNDQPDFVSRQSKRTGRPRQMASGIDV